MKGTPVRLKEFCSVITKGTTPSSIGLEMAKDGVPFLRVQNIQGGRIDLSVDPQYISEGVHRSLARSVIKPNDVLISIAGTIGRTAVVPPDCREMNCNQAIGILRARNSLDPRFLAHWLGSDEASKQIRSSQVTATISNLSLGEIASLKMLPPPLEEQRRIATILDQAEALRAKRRQALAKLDTLTQSLFLEMFGDPIENPRGWMSVTFDSLLDKIESGSSPICLDRRATGEEWGVLKLGAVTRCVYRPEENKALKDTAPDETLEVRVGDVLFSRKNTRDLVAACALVSDTRPRLLIPDLIFRFILKPSAPISKTFLQQLLVMPTKRRAVQSLAGGSAGSMPNISKANLRTVPILTPPMPLQQKFEEVTLVLSAIKKRAEASLVFEESLFSSLQHRAFRGEL